MRGWAFCVLIGCATPPPPIKTPPAPRANRVEPPTGPGARLAAAAIREQKLVVPGAWIDRHPELDAIFPPLATSLDERWVFSSTTVCRSAFYAEDLTTLKSAHGLFSELVAAMAGDERVKEAKLTRNGVRLLLRRERFCVLHDCQPPLSAPSITLDVCDDHVVVADRAAVARAMIAHMSVLEGHEALLAVPGVEAAIVTYARKRDGWDEVSVMLEAAPAAQDELRATLIKRGLAVRDPNLPWAVDSTDKKRSYRFYPPESGTTASFAGRTK